MRVRLGINTCFAVKRWPLVEDWGRSSATGSGCGSSSIRSTWWPTARVGPTPRSWLPLCAWRASELHSTFTGLAAYSDNLLLRPDPAGRQAAATWFGWAIDWTAALGGVATGGHVGAFSVPDWTDPGRRAALWRELQASLVALSGEAHRAGLEYLLVENLAAAREPSTMAMIRDLLTDGDDDRVPVRLCLDVGHMCVPGTAGDDRDPYAWLRELGRAAPVVQLQQSDAEGDHHWPFTAERNAAGRIDADRVLDALDAGGVEETALILEVIPPFEQDDAAVLDDLAASVDYWREALVRRSLDWV